MKKHFLIRKISFGLFIAISLCSCGQSSSVDCEKNLDKIPYFAQHAVTDINNADVLNDFKILRECGQLDSIDVELINGPMLGPMMVSQAHDSKEITYRTILSMINEFKKTDNYKKIKDVRLLENKIVNLSEWETDKQILLNTGMSATDVDNLEKFVKLHEGEKMTFKQAYIAFNETQPQIVKPIKEKFMFNDLVDMDNALKASKESKKPILILFTGYACASVRKMEDVVLTDEKVKSLITENYVSFSAYVDDKTIDAKTNSTVGSKYMKIQSEIFQSNSQPTFIIVDEKGTVLSKTGYTSKVEEFITFLNKGIK